MRWTLDTYRASDLFALYTPKLILYIHAIYIWRRWSWARNEIIMTKKKIKTACISGWFRRQQNWMNEHFMVMIVYIYIFNDERFCARRSIRLRICFYWLITLWIELNFTWCSNDRIIIGPTVFVYEYFLLLYLLYRGHWFWIKSRNSKWYQRTSFIHHP